MSAEALWMISAYSPLPKTVIKFLSPACMPVLKAVRFWKSSFLYNGAGWVILSGRDQWKPNASTKRNFAPLPLLVWQVAFYGHHNGKMEGFASQSNLSAYFDGSCLA